MKTKKPITTHIWVDGSYRNAKKRSEGSFGAVLDTYYTPHKKELSGGLICERLTSSQVELISALIALLHVPKEYQHKKVQVYSDFIELRNVMQSKQAIDPDRTYAVLYQAIENIKNQYGDVEFYYVRGHNKNDGNERAHELAHHTSENLFHETIIQSHTRHFEWNKLMHEHKTEPLDKKILKTILKNQTLSTMKELKEYLRLHVDLDDAVIDSIEDKKGLEQYA